MSYGDYLNKLHFGSVSSGIQAMKDHEMVSQTNPLELKSLGLDSDIDKLTGQLADVQDATDPATTIDNAVSGVGGAIESMAMMKKLYGKIKDAKSKLTGKSKEKSQTDEDNEDTDGGKAKTSEDDVGDSVGDGTGDSVSAAPKSQPQEIEMRNFGETKSDVPDGDNPDEFAYSSDNPGVPQQSRGGQDIEMQDMSKSGDSAPSETSAPSDAPAPSRGGQEIEMQDLSKQPEPTGDHNPEIAQNDPATADRQLEDDVGDLTTEEQSATKTLNSDTSALEEATDGIADAAGDAGEAAGEAAGEIGADVAEDAGEAALEAGGAALDATGIGAVVGIFLQIGGIALAAVQGSEDASTKSTDETAIQNNITADQNKINQIKQQELNIKSQIAQQHFTGANVVPGMSSTTF